MLRNMFWDDSDDDRDKQYLNEKRYNCMEESLKHIHLKIGAIDPYERQIRKQIYFEIVKKLLNKMKEINPLFRQLYSNEIQFVGSSYNGLRVTNANEFDLNIVLKLPVTYSDIIIENSKHPGYVMLNLHQAIKISVEKFERQKRNWHETNKNILKFTPNFYLEHKRLRSFFEGIIAESLSKMNSTVIVGIETYHLRFVKSGPAMTLKIHKANDKTIDVDLVPVVKFENTWPKPHVKPNPCPNVPEWFVIPKEPNAGHLNDSETIEWRLSFAKQEQELMNGLNNMKLTCRLFKCLRDIYSTLFPFKSYFIQNMFLLEIESSETVSWNKSTGWLFAHMLKKWIKHLNDKNLPFFWENHFNLLENIRDSNLCQMRNFLMKILKKIEYLTLEIKNDKKNVEKLKALELYLRKLYKLDQIKTTLDEENTPELQNIGLPEERASWCSIF